MENKKLKLEELKRPSLEEFKQQVKTPVTVVLDNVRSALNVGSVFRTCDAFAIKSLVLLGITPTPPHREILKSAIGATESVAWTHLPNTDALKSYLAKEKLTLISIEQTQNSIGLHQTNWPENCAIVLGNEVNGVSSELLEMSEKCVEIPQFGIKHSLNVSVCAGVVMWSVVGQLKKL